jgi:hypothetical protein
LTPLGGRTTIGPLRTKSLLIGAAATAGFVVIARLTAFQSGHDEAAVPAPAPAPLRPPPAGPEAVPAQGEISVLTLLGEMADLGHLARLPRARFSAGQAASTDRRSRSPDDGDAWFANDDFVTDTQANLVRVESRPDGSKRYVLLDVRGPGAVLRLWTATPVGTLRVYVDDQEQPVLEAPMAALLSGEVPPFVAPLAHVTARGHNLYFPIPYRTRCVVTTDSIVSPDPFTGKPTAKLYYQIGYRSYAADQAANVRPFSAGELARGAHALYRTATQLRGEAAPAPSGPATTADVAAMNVEPGQPSITAVTAPPGGGRITQLRLATSERAPDKLRATMLTMTFDGEQTVRVPLVDFFGTGPGIAAYKSLPMTIGEDGALTCRFPMPFRERAEIRVSRQTAGAVDIRGDVRFEAAPFSDDSLLFHAGWRPRQVVRTRPFRDWHVATLEGRGHLVGTLLNVENGAGTAWWGEGDEKLYVDGEAFPSIFGTGTEDYFGYAWSSGEVFAHPYHAQTRAPANGFGGAFSMNRFHVSDPIPFQRSLRFDFEIWHWTDTAIAIDATLYWYARPGGSDDFHSATAAASDAPRPAAR